MSLFNSKFQARKNMRIEDVQWMRLNTHTDERGKLTAIETDVDVSFDIKRVFYVHDVNEASIRGGHAHRETDQFAVAVSGTVRIVVSDGVNARKIILNNPSAGVLLPRMTWTSLTDFSPGAVCLVLASTRYDISASIRNWADYLLERKLPRVAEFTDGPETF
jgi:dTDP-4-dehydrorhamnose 3,5-epimerase-like enzyme